MSPQKIIYSCKSWKEFTDRLSELPTKKERGTVFEWFCKFYLQTNPKYKLYYKNVWHSSEFVKQTKHQKKLKIPDPEIGTDLVGQTVHGKYEIIQCKYKDDVTKNIYLSDIKSSITVASREVTRNYVDTILMCSNCQALTAKIKKLKHELQITSLLGGDFETMNPDDFKNIRKAIKNQVPVYKPKILMKHQKDAIDAIKKHFNDIKASRAQLIHACGTGKTITSYYAFKQLSPKLTVVLMPGLHLINQTLNEWSRESLANKEGISSFVVCSDASIEKQEENDPALWLEELGIKSTTDIDDIKKFLGNRNLKRKVIFSTYQSGKVLSSALRTLKKKVDLAIFDEAHNTARPKNKLFAHLLDEKNISIKKRLFMTATPKKLIGKNNKVASMDDESMYGKVVDELTVKDAIENSPPLLNDYQIITQIVTNAEVQELLKINPFVIDKKRLPQEVELKLIAAGLTLKKVFKKNKIKQAISFHSRVNRARRFARGINNILKSSDKVNPYHVNGKQSGTLRHRILEEFRTNPPSLVTNARCLSEGVNVPSVDAIIFVDPRQSKVDITQAIGRSLRKPRNETKGNSFIIVPTVIDESDPKSIDEAHQQILMVLRSMAEHDGRIVEYFRLVAAGKKPPRKFIETNSEDAFVNFNLDEFTQELHVKAWSRLARLGRRPFEQAREYVRSLGLQSSTEYRKFMRSKDAPVDIPIFPEDRYKEWVNWPNFIGTKDDKERFEEFVKYYKEYAASHKIPIPKASYITPDGYKLSTKYRSVLNSYQKEVLPGWKIKALNALGDIWSWDGKDSYMWNRAFEAYSDYRKEGGKELPPKGTVHNRVRVDIFSENQKKKYRAMSEPIKDTKPLTKEQLKKLQDINFNFGDVYEENWNSKFEIARKLLVKHQGKIPDSEKESKAWVTKQRTKYKKGKLGTDKIKLLESIPKWSWDPFDDALKHNLLIVKDYVEKTGDIAIPQNTTHLGKAIGIFITSERDKYRKGEIKKWVLEELETIGVKMEPKSTKGFITEY